MIVALLTSILKTLSTKSIEPRKSRVEVGGDSKSKIDNNEVDSNKIDSNEIRNNEVTEEKNHQKM